MSDTLTTGQCLCGQVKYTLTGQPLRMMQCHCKGCQRATGTGHINNAFFKAEQFDLQGNVKGYEDTADSGNVNVRYFCPECGSRIYNEITARKGIVGVAVGTADDNEWFKPDGVVYCSNRPSWDMTSTDVPNFDEMPPPPPAK